MNMASSWGLRVRRNLLVVLLVVSCAGALLAQRYRGRGRGGGEGWIPEDAPVRTAREVPTHSTEFPRWTNTAGFEKDVFTFARAIFKVGPNAARGYGQGRRLGWWVDFPDADLNLSYRLQQMTSMRTDPDGRVLKLNNPDLHNYPFLLMEHPGYMMLRDEEVAGLRKYLLAGGVLAVIDFWNAREWQGFADQMKRVLPERHSKPECAPPVRGMR